MKPEQTKSLVGEVVQQDNWGPTLFPAQILLDKMTSIPLLITAENKEKNQTDDTIGLLLPSLSMLQ